MDPLVKWAGGKRGLLPEIRRRIPTGVTMYVEPFAGGAAVLLDLLPPCAVLCDVNPELANMYSVVSAAPEELISHLKTHTVTKDHYLEVRGWDRDPNFLLKRSPVERASRFMFLNRSCFNGLWRVSSKGFFNVSWAKPTHLAFPGDDHIRAVGAYLKRSVKVMCATYGATLYEAAANPGAFYYLDPPYMGSFTSYSSDGFGDDEHRRLAAFCRNVSAAGARFLLSSSDCPMARELYKEFSVEEVRTRRSVGAKSATRKSVGELLVSPKVVV